MKKTTSIILGIVLLTIALALFTTENMWGAAIGTGCLLFAVINIRYADDKNNDKNN